MGRYCGLERWDTESLILITFICLKYKTRSLAETRWRRWCEKESGEKSHLGSGKRSLSKKDGYLSGASEWLELGLGILRP